MRAIERMDPSDDVLLQEAQQLELDSAAQMQAKAS